MLAIRHHVTGLREVRNELRLEVKAIRLGVARGLTAVAKDAHRVVGMEMLRVFNRPGTYARRSFFVWPADPRGKREINAVIGLKDDPQYTVHPLTPQVVGGTRRTKRFERALQSAGAMQPGWYAVPTEDALDGSGKVRKGLVQQIVAQAKSQLVAGYSKQLRLRKDTGRERMVKRNAANRAGGQFVFVPRRRGKLSPGVYLAEGSGTTKRMGPWRKNPLIKLFNYVSSVNYQPRLDFFGIVERVVDQRVESALRNALLYSR